MSFYNWMLKSLLKLKASVRWNTSKLQLAQKCIHVHLFMSSRFQQRCLHNCNHQTHYRSQTIREQNEYKTPSVTAFSSLWPQPNLVFLNSFFLSFFSHSHLLYIKNASTDCLIIKSLFYFLAAFAVGNSSNCNSLTLALLHCKSHIVYDTGTEQASGLEEIVNGVKTS